MNKNANTYQKRKQKAPQILMNLYELDCPKIPISIFDYGTCTKYAECFPQRNILIVLNSGR